MTIRRLDGSVDTQPAYDPSTMSGIVKRGARTGKGRPNHLKIVLKHAGPCCVCGKALRVGERAWWWPRLHLISCARHEPRTPKATPS